MVINNVFFCLAIFFCFYALPAQAQKDTPKTIGKVLDSIKTPTHSPSRAALYSAVLPGLGQAYNKKNAYWKVPLLCIGGAALGYFIHYNNKGHLDYRDSYVAKLYNLPNDPHPRLSIENVQRIKNQYQHDRDLLIIFTIGVYGLNVLDAFVEGHLKSFNVDDNLSLRFSPYTESISGQSFAGASLKLTFR